MVSMLFSYADLYSAICSSLAVRSDRTVALGRSTPHRMRKTIRTRIPIAPTSGLRNLTRSMGVSSPPSEVVRRGGVEGDPHRVADRLGTGVPVDGHGRTGGEDPGLGVREPVDRHGRAGGTD